MTSQSFSSRSLLELDPDLGQRLSAERALAAGRELHVAVRSLKPGEWRPTRAVSSSAAGIGVLIVDGVVAREVRVHDAPSAELFGPGDIIRTASTEASLELLQSTSRWQALTAVTVASLDAQVALALRYYPEISAIVFDRFDARGQRLALTQAISQITGVDTRVEALLWHLAGRWGRVGREQMIIPLTLSHSLIGALIGARRPTVSSALARLAERGRVKRRPDGSWLLSGLRPPEDLAPNDQSALRPPRPLRFAGRSERPVAA